MSSELGLRQLRRRGGGIFVEAMKARDFNELKAAIVAYEQVSHCPEARKRLMEIKFHCIKVRHDYEEMMEAIREAYDSHWKATH